MRARVDGRAVDVPRWVTFAARAVPSDRHEGYDAQEVWGACSRCFTERAVALASMPQPAAEAALGAFSLHHRGCENVVERAARVGDDREQVLRRRALLQRQVPVPAIVLAGNVAANDNAPPRQRR